MKPTIPCGGCPLAGGATLLCWAFLHHGEPALAADGKKAPRRRRPARTSSGATRVPGPPPHHPGQGIPGHAARRRRLRLPRRPASTPRTRGQTRPGANLFGTEFPWLRAI